MDTENCGELNYGVSVDLTRQYNGIPFSTSQRVYKMYNHTQTMSFTLPIVASSKESAFHAVALKRLPNDTQIKSQFSFNCLIPNVFNF